MSWKIKDFKEYESGQLKGFFTLEAGILEIRGCKCLDGEWGLWVSFPGEKYEDKEGKDQYNPYVKIPDKEKYKDFQKWAQVELEKIVGVEPDPDRGTEKDDISF